jgi:hypothetical protein
MLLFILGCPGSVGTVSGKVYYGGKPLSGGTVTFYPEKGGGFVAGVGSDGSYMVVNVPAGGVKIAVQVPQAPPRRRPDKGGGKQAPGYEKEIQEHSAAPVPAEYADPGKSGLSLTVERGRQTHDIRIPGGR